MAVGLVLEGGGTRGAYSSGVLDVFLEEGIEFPRVYGISAGACNALSYISKQIRRNFNIFYQYIGDSRYLSVSNLRKHGCIFGFDFIFGELSHELLPFDYQAFFSSPVELKVGATDVETGEIVYFSKKDMDEEFIAVRASSSLPMLSRIVSFQGYQLLDGGVAQPIALERSLLDGNERNVIVLTRDDTYRKKAYPGFSRTALRAFYGDYPKLVDCMLNRWEIYNEEVEQCREQERQGNAVVVRPSKPILVSRYEKDCAKLKEIYELGRKDALEKVPAIREILARP